MSDEFESDANEALEGKPPDGVLDEQELCEAEFEIVPLLQEDIEDAPSDGPSTFSVDLATGNGSPHRTAICLSGGGIRSASFSLGVLQGLAKAKLLEKSGYLSAVSGGNYTMSWLTRWRSEVGAGAPWSQDDLKERPENFSNDQRDLDQVRRLRSYSNYLSPRTGLNKDGVTFLFSALRKFSFNLISWLLVFLTAATFVHAAIAGLGAALVASEGWSGWPLLEPTPLIVPPLEFRYDTIGRLLVDPVIAATLVPPLFAAVFVLFGWARALFFLRSDFIEQEAVSRKSAGWTLFALTWFFVFVFFAVIPEFLWDVASVQEGGSNFTFLTFIVGSSATVTGLVGLWANAPQVVRDKTKDLTGKLKAFALELLAIALIASLAIGSGYFVRWVASETWFAPATVEESGAWVGAIERGRDSWTQLTEAVEAADKPKPDNTDTTGRASAAITEDNATSEPPSFEESVKALKVSFSAITEQETRGYGSTWPWFIFSFLGMAFLAFAFSELTGANRSSLHSVYSTRLVRAFLGTARNDRKPNRFANHDYQLNDDILLSRVGFGKFRNPPGSDPVQGPDRHLSPLFPVINMTLNLKGGRGNRQDWQERRGAPFIATPLHVGSELLRDRQGKANPATGYVPIEALEGDGDLSRAQITLGRAMTISGAAASPNMGFYTRPIVAIAMAILNIRLGWWLRNPVRQGEDELPYWWPFAPSSIEPFGGILYLLREAFGLLSEKDRWLYLSDGGHFDNLGLYEMVRRRCRQILVIDAGADPNFEYSDLLSTVRKIRVDFGIEIDLPASLPGQEGEGKNQRFVMANIRYSELPEAKGKPKLEDGRLILLKPILLGEEPPGLAQYAKTSARGSSVFPHQSTVDQFFDEPQFESYRLLGAFSVGAMLAKLKPGLFTLVGGTFSAHYPQEEKQEDGSPDEPGTGAKNDNGQGDQSWQDDGMMGLADSFASAIQNLPTSELLLKAVGTVAAASITFTVAVEGTDGLKNAVGDVAEVVAPPLTPRQPQKVVIETVNDPQLVRALTDLNARLEQVQTALNDSSEQLQNLISTPGDHQHEVEDLDLGKIEAELETIKTGIGELPGKITVKVPRNRSRDIDINTSTNRRQAADIITLQGESRAQRGTLLSLQSGGNQTINDINALQRQIDFLRRQLDEIARLQG